MKAIKSFSAGYFLEKHPYLATVLVCLCSLMFSQTYYISYYTKVGSYGDFSMVWQVPFFALVVLLLCAVCTFIKQKEANKYKRLLYISASFGAAFLALRYMPLLPDTARGVVLLAAAVLLLVLFVTLIAVKKRPASILALAAVLCASATLGVSYLLLACAVAIYCCVIYVDDSNFKKQLPAMGALLLCALAVVLSGFLLNSVKEQLIVSGFFICLGLFAVAYTRGKLKIPPLILLMFGLGLVMRFIYVLDITLPEQQHDVFNWFSEYPRHNTYIKYIYENWALPTEENTVFSGLSQFYHPPLHHFLAALWMKVQTLCGITLLQAYENVQYLTLTYSALMMVAGYKLLCEFKLKGVALYTSFALLAFHPTFYIFAGSVNNDALTTLFLFLSMLYTVRWFKNPSFKHTVILAVTIGLGMMTKLSGAMIAFGTGFVFLYALFTTKTGGFWENAKALWKKFAVFAAISFPLGLWWPIRCKILFDMPLGYVPALSPEADQFIGNYSFWERLTGAGSFDLSNIYPNIGYIPNGTAEGEKLFDYGIFPYAIKTALFGEYYNLTKVSALQNVFAYIMMFASLVLIAISLVGLIAGIVSCLKRNDNNDGLVNQENLIPFIFLGIYYLFLVGSYVSFCFKFPHTCTMDFRYIVPALLIGAVWSGLLLKGKGKWILPFKICASVATLLFSIGSVVFFAF